MSANSANSKNHVFSCQSTNLIKASSAPIWDIQQHMLDVSLCTQGTALTKPLEFTRLLLSSLSLKVQKLLGVKKHLILNGNLRRTPTASLNLGPGEFVEVKRKEEILATLDFKGRNRGLSFTPEMLKYCGGRYRVMRRIDKMINEQTGRMRQIANTVILERVTCDGSAHGGCSRTCYCLWREIWLKRAEHARKM